MSGGTQGVRSSRTEPITDCDRRRLRKLDRAIAKLDYEIWVLSAWNRPVGDQKRALRDQHDRARKWLRHWMKGVKSHE